MGRARASAPLSSPAPEPPTRPRPSTQQTKPDPRSAMPNLLTPLDRPPRGAVTLLVALAALFLLGPTAGVAAREDASTKKVSKQTIVQKHASGDRSSGTSDAPSDTDMPKGIKVGDGEISVGDVYAGNGCVKAGDITVGDCDEKSSGGGGSRNGNSDDNGSDDGASEDGTSG